MAINFEQPGAIDTGEDPVAMEAPANGLGDMMAKATASAREVLDFGRRKHGLIGGGEQQASNGYLNDRMPARPGTQSDSGAKPIQPMPGPLPPTANPFGKRSEAEPAPDEEAGAIDTEETS